MPASIVMSPNNDIKDLPRRDKQKLDKHEHNTHSYNAQTNTVKHRDRLMASILRCDRSSMETRHHQI